MKTGVIRLVLFVCETLTGPFLKSMNYADSLFRARAWKRGIAILGLTAAGYMFIAGAVTMSLFEYLFNPPPMRGVGDLVFRSLLFGIFFWEVAIGGYLLFDIDGLKKKLPENVLKKAEKEVGFFLKNENLPFEIRLSAQRLVDDVRSGKGFNEWTWSSLQILAAKESQLVKLEEIDVEELALKAAAQAKDQHEKDVARLVWETKQLRGSLGLEVKDK